MILAMVMVPHYMRGRNLFALPTARNSTSGAVRARLAGAIFPVFWKRWRRACACIVACIPIRLLLGEQVCSLGGLVDPILGAILLFVGLSLLYTYIGGVKAVIWTDAVQFGLFLLGRTLCAVLYPDARSTAAGAAVMDARRARRGNWRG